MNGLITLPDWGAPLNGAREILICVALPLVVALVWSAIGDSRSWKWWRNR